MLRRAILIQLMNDFSIKKASKDLGYFIALITIYQIGQGFVRQHSGVLIFPVHFSCLTFKIFPGEVLEGTIHKIMKHGVFLQCSPLLKKFTCLTKKWVVSSTSLGRILSSEMRSRSSLKKAWWSDLWCSQRSMMMPRKISALLLTWMGSSNLRRRCKRILVLVVHQQLAGLRQDVAEEVQMRYFFFTAMLYFYGRILSQRLVNTVTTDKVLYKLVSRFIKYHMVTCYFLYIAGFMWFILTLKKKMYKYQFGQYAWTHMILIVVFTQSAFTVANIFEGIFWFLLPASLIVINDIAAYFFGFFFGRTPLIKLSPKKTWEGFIGASVTTMISAFVLANLLGRFQWLTCPRKDLSTGWLHCDSGSLFAPEDFTIPKWFPEWFPWREISIFPVQWHALCLGLFASIIAPFGGFFASGFKRAFKIKDFGDSIPGHGGITDRMDCQMVMAVFAYIYLHSFVVPQSLSIEMIMDQILMNLTFEEQQALYTKLGHIIMEKQYGES